MTVRKTFRKENFTDDMMDGLGNDLWVRGRNIWDGWFCYLGITPLLRYWVDLCSFIALRNDRLA
jgi:hypothetical protein